jgi:hypothetical protein
MLYGTAFYQDIVALLHRSHHIVMVQIELGTVFYISKKKGNCFYWQTRHGITIIADINDKPSPAKRIKKKRRG